MKKRKKHLEMSPLFTCTNNHDNMTYASWDMECNRHNFLSFWAIFCPFFPLLTPNIKIYWFLRYLRHNGQRFLSFWTVFCLFTPLTTWKTKILKKWKISLKIISFYRCVLQMKIIWRMVPEIWKATDRIFSHFGPFFAFLPLNNPENQNFEKKKTTKKTSGDIILHMWNKNYDQMMYSSWDMVHDEPTDTQKKWHIGVRAPPNKNILQNWYF